MQTELVAGSGRSVDRSSVFSQPAQPRCRSPLAHRCREVLIAMLDHAAPDADMTAADPESDKTDRGVPIEGAAGVIATHHSEGLPSTRRSIMIRSLTV